MSVQALQHLMSDQDSPAVMQLPQHWMRSFFLAAHALESQHNHEALSRLQACLFHVLRPDVGTPFWLTAHTYVPMQSMSPRAPGARSLKHGMSRCAGAFSIVPQQ
jgi:hypothetical protein